MMIRESSHFSVKDGQRYDLYFDQAKKRVRGVCPQAARTGHRKEISVDLRHFPDFFERKQDNVYQQLSAEVQTAVRLGFPLDGVSARHRVLGTNDHLVMGAKGLMRQTGFGCVPANPANYPELAMFTHLFRKPEGHPALSASVEKRERSTDSCDRVAKKPRLGEVSVFCDDAPADDANAAGLAAHLAQRISRSLRRVSLTRMVGKTS